MNEPKWWGIGRHVLGFVGAFLVTKGLITSEEAAQGTVLIYEIGGGLLSLIAIWTSARAREKNITNAQFKAMRR